MMNDQRYLQILKDVRTLLCEPECWIRGRYAEKASGIQCKSTNPMATRWCIMGAVSKVTNGLVSDFEKRFESDLPFISSIEAWNDEITHPTLIATLDSLIEGVKS